MATTASSICDLCLEAAQESLSDYGMEEDDFGDMAEVVMLEMGADLPDHFCDATESGSTIRCSCACRRTR